MWPNPQFPAEYVIFTEEILNGKLHFHFFCSVSVFEDCSLGVWGYNHGNNIVGLFDVLSNFPFTSSERNAIISNKQCVYELPHELSNDLKQELT